MNKNETEKKLMKKLMLFFLGCAVLVLLSTLFFFLALLYLKTSTMTSSDPHGMYKYTYKRIDPQTEITNVGFMSLPKKLENGYEYYYDDSDEFFYVVSDFSISEEVQAFRCTSSCYCHEDDELRRTGTISSTSSMKFLGKVVTLVAALSSYVAYEISKDKLNSECEKLGDELGENIFCETSIRDMYPYDQDCEYMDPRILEAERTKDPEEIFSDDWDRYICYGRCVTRNFHDFPIERKKAAQLHHKASQYGCEDIELEVFIQNFDYCQLQTPEQIEERWMKDELQEWCVGESVDWKGEFDLKDTACVAYNPNGPVERNPTVKCVRQEHTHEFVDETTSEKYTNEFYREQY